MSGASLALVRIIVFFGSDSLITVATLLGPTFFTTGLSGREFRKMTDKTCPTVN
jgi:hypothetical protein